MSQPAHFPESPLNAAPEGEEPQAASAMATSRPVKPEVSEHDAGILDAAGLGDLLDPGSVQGDLDALLGVSEADTAPVSAELTIADLHLSLMQMARDLETLSADLKDETVRAGVHEALKTVLAAFKATQ